MMTSQWATAPRTVVPDGSLVRGIPGKVVRAPPRSSSADMESREQSDGEPGWVLGIETSHAPGSVALGRGRELRAELFPPGLVHARELFPAIDRLFVAERLEREALSLVAVSIGPGSYTGIRIGAAAAKGIAWALSIPVLGVSTLEVIASNVTVDGEFAVVLDARRGACYGARFARKGESMVRLEVDRLVDPLAFIRSLPAGTALVGSGAGVLPGTAALPRLDAALDLPRAVGVVGIARARAARIARGEEPAPECYRDPHRLLPVYLRASEAEEKREARRSRGGE